MGNASDWEPKHASLLNELKTASDDGDSSLVNDILNQIAPRPEGPNVHEPGGVIGGLFGPDLEVIDPETGQRDNADGPAVVKGDGTREWYRFGMLHNVSGPAVVKPDGTVEYYYLGEKCACAEHLDEMVKAAQEHEDRALDWHDIQDEDA